MNKCLNCNSELNTGNKFCCKRCEADYRFNSLKESLVGKQFGKWTVIGFRRSSSCTKWVCRCECGIEREQVAATLINGNTTQCNGCARRHKGIVPYYVFSRYQRDAKRRNIHFDLQLKNLVDLLEQQEYKCAYTGENIQLAASEKEHSHGQSTASLDRIDSNKSYSADNVQWVHKEVNKMKMDLGHLRFIELCRKVATNAKTTVE